MLLHHNAKNVPQNHFFYWFKMKEFQTSGEIYEELKLLGQQYRHYMKLHLLSLAELTHLLDLTMPGIP